jgi:hypothetical protein
MLGPDLNTGLWRVPRLYLTETSVDTPIETHLSSCNADAR